jgi:hypothetical protein
MNRPNGGTVLASNPHVHDVVFNPTIEGKEHMSQNTIWGELSDLPKPRVTRAHDSGDRVQQVLVDRVSACVGRVPVLSTNTTDAEPNVRINSTWMTHYMWKTSRQTRGIWMDIHGGLDPPMDIDGGADRFENANRTG